MDYEALKQVGEVYLETKSVKETADRCEISEVKARRILITIGLWSSESSERVGKLSEQGLSTAQIAEKLALSIKAVEAYLPYRRGVYGLDEKSAYALRSELYRERKKTAEVNMINRSGDQNPYSDEAYEKLRLKASEAPYPKAEVPRAAFEPRAVYHLRFELVDTDQLTDAEKKLAKAKKSISRDVLVNGHMNLHALHYMIQRLFGWQNSHLHHFALQQDDFDLVTAGRLGTYADLCGALFRFPDDDAADKYWDDDYDDSVSVKTWLQTKYSSLRLNRSVGDTWVGNRVKLADFRKKHPHLTDTMHILITPKITGTQEAIDAIQPLVDEVDQLGVTTLGMWAGIMPATTVDLIGSAVERINSYTNSLDYNGWQRFWASLRGESTDKGVLNTSMSLDFSADTVAELSTYVAEIVSAIKQGQQVSEDDLANLHLIVTFLNGLDTYGIGTHILEGVGVGMTEAGWDSDAETVATNLETALNMALGIQSPSTRVKPVGDNVAAGVGAGMAEYDFTTDASTIATNLVTALDATLTTKLLTGTATTTMGGLASGMSAYSFVTTGSTVSAGVKSALSASLNSTTLRSVGVNAMAGLKAGINAGKSGVISAMRSAANAAVSAAKSQLKIASPSGVFRDEVGVMTMRGFGEGVLEETKAQAKIIRNASRYLTGEAKAGAISTTSNDNRKTYNTNQSVNLTVQSMQIRDEQDIRSLAVEIATLTRRQQRGRGLRMA